MKQTKLKQLREKNGLSQSNLAYLSEINYRVLQTYEQGARNIDGAKIETLFSLAKTLNCRISDLIENEELANELKENGY